MLVAEGRHTSCKVKRSDDRDAADDTAVRPSLRLILEDWKKRRSFKRPLSPRDNCRQKFYFRAGDQVDLNDFSGKQIAILPQAPVPLRYLAHRRRCIHSV